MTLKTRLSQMSDELLDYATKVPDDEARILRNAAYDLENVRTSKAVGELVNVAYAFHGGQGVTDFTVLRERREKAA